MKKNVLLALLEDGEKVSLYSPRFEDEQFTEFEKFLLTYKDAFPEDVRQLVYRLDIIKRELLKLSKLLILKSWRIKTHLFSIL